MSAEDALRGSTVVVTGAGSGMGWLAAKAFAEAGGPWAVAQLHDTHHTLEEVRCTDETFCRLDEISPGPGGEAPEAYAW